MPKTGPVIALVICRALVAGRCLQKRPGYVYPPACSKMLSARNSSLIRAGAIGFVGRAARLINFIGHSVIIVEGISEQRFS